MKPSLAETYVEMTDAEWRASFMLPAMERRDRLENERLTVEQLIEENEDQLLEAFTYFLGLPFEQQLQCAQQFKDGLERVKELRDNNRKRAQRMLERQRG
jgi:hypothetical protein